MLTLDEVRIEDPGFYSDNPFPLYARLQEDDPVHLREDLRMWVLTRYDDIVSVAKQPNLFSAKRGTLLQEALAGHTLAGEYFIGDEFVENTDPPRHNELRRLISPAFTPKRVADLEASVRNTCRKLVAALPAGKSVEYISEVAALVPLITVADLLGVVDYDVREMAEWNAELMKCGIDRPEEERRESVLAFWKMNDFIRAQFAAKRAHPAADLLSTLLTAEIDNEVVSEENILTWAALVLAGGAETTQALLGNMVENLGLHPEQLAMLAANPDMATAAIEEVLRWKTLAHGFVRSVSEPTEFGGHELKKNDWVYMLHQAANWDKTKFDNPSVFDVTAPRTHDNLAFGVGQHFCPGNRLSRLEGRVLLEELLARFPRWDIDSVTPVVSVLRTGCAELHVTFHEP